MGLLMAPQSLPAQRKTSPDEREEVFIWEREGDWVCSRAWAASAYLGLRSLKCYLMCGDGDRGGFFPLFVVLVRREFMHPRHWFHPFIWLN